MALKRAGVGTMECQQSTLHFLDLDNQVHSLIFELLSTKDLCTLCGVCQYLRACIVEGAAAGKLWHRHCADLLGPGVVELHAQSVSEQAARSATFWRHLYRNSLELPVVRWWRKGSRKLQRSVHQDDEEHLSGSGRFAPIALENGPTAEEQAPAGHPSLLDGFVSANGSPGQALLARSGHTASLLGRRVVITGGILRDGSTFMDVIMINLDTLTVTQPRAYGQVPVTRFRHAAVAVSLPTGCAADLALSEALPSWQTGEGSSVLLLLGGHNSHGEQFGGQQLEVLVVADSGRDVFWASLPTTGPAPSPRYHHSADVLGDGHTVVVFGGEGADLQDDVEHPVYILDAAALTWERRTTVASRDLLDCPGQRSLHLSTTRVDPETGREELVIVGGYCRDALVEMYPYALDLASFEWRRFPAPNGEQSVLLPPPRQRAAAVKVTGIWLLVVGGQGLQDNFLDDVHKLHLPTLMWRTPPRAVGRPSRHVRCIAGHTAAGLVTFGGCVPTIMGIMPVPKIDVMLLGDLCPLPAEQLRPAWSRQDSRRSSGSCASANSAGSVASSELLFATQPPVAGAEDQEAVSRRRGAGGHRPSCLSPQATAHRPAPLEDLEDKEATVRGFRMRQRRVREVAFTLADVRLRLWRDSSTGLLYASQPPNMDVQDSSSEETLSDSAEVCPVAGGPWSAAEERRRVAALTAGGGQGGSAELRHRGRARVWHRIDSLEEGAEEGTCGPTTAAPRGGSQASRQGSRRKRSMAPRAPPVQAAWETWDDDASVGTGGMICFVLTVILTLALVACALPTVP